MKIPSFSALLTTTALLAGCSLAPDLYLPEMSIPEAFKEAPKAAASANETVTETGSWKQGEPADQQERGQWWRAFGDEKLNALQDEAAKQNQSLAAMAARVMQARATADIAFDQFIPGIDGNAGVSREQPSAVIPGATSSRFKPLTRYSAGLGLNYEIDLFGRILENSRAAEADANAVEANYNSMLLALQADVAQTYFALRAVDAERKLVKENLALREQAFDIINKRLEAGYSSELDQSRERVELENVRAQALQLDQNREQLEHALAVLTGKPPAALTFEESEFTLNLPTIPAGLPSSLLERRPDIAAAQYQLAAANSRIGIARAAFFPKLALTSTGGYESSAFDNLFDWSSRTWSIGPLLTVPIFQGGRALANLDRSKAAYEEAVSNYRQQVLVAFREVEDHLSAIRSLAQQAQAADAAVLSASRAAAILENQFMAGDVSFIERADAKRSELSSQQQQIRLRREQANATIQLIRALGGGWDKPVAVATPAEETTGDETAVKSDESAQTSPATEVKTQALEPQAEAESTQQAVPAQAVESSEVSLLKQPNAQSEPLQPAPLLPPPGTSVP